MTDSPRVRVQVTKNHGVFRKGQVLVLSINVARIYCEQGWAIILGPVPTVGPTEYKGIEKYITIN